MQLKVITANRKINLAEADNINIMDKELSLTIFIYADRVVATQAYTSEICSLQTMEHVRFPPLIFHID